MKFCATKILLTSIIAATLQASFAQVKEQEIPMVYASDINNTLQVRSDFTYIGTSGCYLSQLNSPSLEPSTNFIVNGQRAPTKIYVETSNGSTVMLPVPTSDSIFNMPALLSPYSANSGALFTSYSDSGSNTFLYNGGTFSQLFSGVGSYLTQEAQPACFHGQCIDLVSDSSSKTTQIMSFDSANGSWTPAGTPFDFQVLSNGLINGNSPFIPAISENGTAYFVGHTTTGGIQLLSLNLATLQKNLTTIPIDPSAYANMSVDSTRVHLMQNGDVVVTLFAGPGYPAKYQIFVFSPKLELLYQSKLFDTLQSSGKVSEIPGYGSFISGNLLFLNAGSAFEQQQMSRSLEILNFDSDKPEVIPTPKLPANLTFSEDAYVLPSNHGNFWVLQTSFQGSTMTLVPVFEQYNLSSQEFTAHSYTPIAINTNSSYPQLFQNIVPFGADPLATAGFAGEVTRITAQNTPKANLWFVTSDAQTLTFHVIQPNGQYESKTIASPQGVINISDAASCQSWNQNSFLYSK